MSKIVSPPPCRSRCYLWALGLLWSAAILGLGLWYYVDRTEDELEIARNYARAVHGKDVVYRRWNALHGGVYVPVTGDTAPSPFLQVPERDVVTPSGRTLTLVNPAYMTRQVHKTAADQGESRARIVSNKPLNPANASDAWEAEALQSFEQGGTEAAQLAWIDGHQHMRLVRPLYVEEGCLKCHASQGYRIGDVRRGISVAVPVESIWSHASGRDFVLLVGYGAVGVLGLLGIVLGGTKVRHYLRQREQAMEALRESERKLSTLIGNLPGMAYRCKNDPHWTMEYVSQGCVRLTGFEREQLFGNCVIAFADLIHPEDRAMVRNRVQEALAQRLPFQLEYRLIAASGEEKWVWEHGAGVFAENGEILALEGYITDVSTRKRAEEALRASEQRYRLLAQNVKDVIWTCTMNFEWTYISPSFEALTGYAAEEALEIPLTAMVTPRTAELAAALMAERQHAVAANPALLAKPVSLEAEFYCKNGGTVWTEVVASFMLSGEGTPLGLIGVTRDISARKTIQVQLAKARDFAEAANRAKSEFLANMSHEIRTPMTAILGYADLLLENATRPEDVEALKTIQQNGRHLLGIINGILDLSKIEAGKLAVDMVPCSPQAVVAEVVSLMRVPAQGKGIPLAVEYKGPIPETIRSDPARLRQILINLLGNAIKFTEFGEVRLAVRLLDEDPRHARMQFRVIDTGIGIAEEEARGLFQPFSQAQTAVTENTEAPAWDWRSAGAWQTCCGATSRWKARR